MELLDHIVILCSILGEFPDCFSQQLYHFPMYKGSNFSVFSPTLVILCFFVIATLEGV